MTALEDRLSRALRPPTLQQALLDPTLASHVWSAYLSALTRKRTASLIAIAYNALDIEASLPYEARHGRTGARCRVVAKRCGRLLEPRAPLSSITILERVLLAQAAVR